MRHQAITLITAAVLAANLAACADVIAPLPPGTHLDGETIFRGLAFGEAPVADALPEVWGRVASEDPTWTPTQREAVAHVKKQVIEDIRTLDPTFFNRFRSATTSGGHIRISRAIDESGVLLRRVIEARYGRPRDVPEVCLTDVQCQINLAVNVNVAANINVALNFNAAVNLNAAVNINLYVNVNIFQNVNFWFGGHDQGTSDSMLQSDQIIQLIATRLKGR